MNYFLIALNLERFNNFLHSQVNGQLDSNSLEWSKRVREEIIVKNIFRLFRLRRELTIVGQLHNMAINVCLPFHYTAIAGIALCQPTLPSFWR